MRTLTDWYPGDELVFAGLEVLGMVTILLALTWAVEHLLARRRAALRSALWLSALVGILLTPALAWLGRQLQWHVVALPRGVAASARSAERPSHAVPAPTLLVAGPPAAAEAGETAALAARRGPPEAIPSRSDPPPVLPGAAAGSSATARGSRARKPEETAAVAAEPPAPPLSPPRALASFALLVWGLGSAYLAARLLHGCWRVRQLGRRVRPLEAERWAAELAAVARALAVPRLPEIGLSPDVRSPLVAVLFPPRVVLPSRLLDCLPPSQVREVLVHECAHVVRRDPWVHLLQHLALILFWVHPLVSLLNRRLDQAREEVCDNYVLAQGDAPGYAETLLAVAQLCYPVPRWQGYLTMIPRSHHLERRVAGLLEAHRDTTTRLPTRHRVAVPTALFLMLMALASVGSHDAASAPDEPSQTASPTQTPPQEQTPPRAADRPAESAVVGKVTGRVIHAADSRPVAGADVRLIRPGKAAAPAPAYRTTTNAQGEFTFGVVAPGKYYVLSIRGNLASRSRRYQSDLVTVASDGASQPVVLRMQPGIPVRVKVHSAVDATPIQGARVRLTWTDLDRDHFTDAQGQVELLALTPETWHVEAAARDHAAVVQVLNLANEQPAALEMNLLPGGSVQGILKDESGRPLSGFGVNVYSSDRPGVPRDYVETDAEGRYRFDYLPLGQNLQLYMTTLEYVRETREFRLDAGKGQLAQLDVILKKRPHGGSVEGIVGDRQGKAIAGAEVVNRGNSTAEVRRAKADAQGKFLLDNVYADSFGHHLVVRAKGFAPQRIEFKPGSATRPTEVAVTLEPGHRIQGRVLNEAGKPIPGVRVVFAHGTRHPGGELGGFTTTDAEGRFQFDSLPANAPFAFEAEGYSEIPEWQLPLDGDKEVVVTMKSEGVLKGRVVDEATGKPIARFNVRITSSPDHQPGDPSTSLLSSRIDPGEDFVSAPGQFLLKDLMAGMPLQVSIAAEGYRRQVVRGVVAKPASDAQAVGIRLMAEDPAKLLTVRGKLVNHRGDGVRGVELRLLVATERPARRDDFPFNWQMIETNQIEQDPSVLQVQRQTTGADGSFVLQRVPSDAEIELVYWGKGIPGGRRDHLEKLSEKERTDLVVQALAPARIVGTIDRKAFPEFSRIQLSGSARYYEAVVAADGKSFVIDDLPPGKYEVEVHSPSMRVEGKPGLMRQTLLGRKRVTLAEGNEETGTLGEADRVGSRTP